MTIGATVKNRLRARQRKRHRTWWPIILSATFGFIALILGAVLFKPQGPRYGGKPTRYWIEQLAGDDPDKAVEALSAMGAPAIPYLLDALQMQSSETWSENLLGRMSDWPLLGRLADKLSEQRSRRAEIPDGAAEVLVSLRKEANNFAPELVRIYQHPKRSEEVIERAAQVLVDLGPDAASSMPSFLTHLRGTDRARKSLTVSILSAIGPQAKDAVPLLTNLFNGDGWNDLSVAEALWNIDRRTNDTVNTCLRLLEGRNRRFAEELTRRVTALLTRMGPAAKEAIPPLRDLFLKGPAATRFAVEQALRGIDVPTLDALQAEANRMARRRIEKIVASLGQQTIWTPTPERTNFFNALPAIAALGPEARSACGRLVELLTTTPPTVSKVEENYYRTKIPFLTVRALGQIGDATGLVVSALASHLRSTNPIVAQACCEALGELGPPARAATPALCELLKAEATLLRLAAAMALVKITPDTATVVPVLHELETVQDPRVQNAAKLARWKIELASDIASTSVPALGELETIQVRYRLFDRGVIWQKRDPEREGPSPLDDLLFDSLTGFFLDKIRLLGWVGPEAKSALPQLIGIVTTNSLPSLRLRVADAIRRIDPATYENLRLPGPLALPDNLED